MIIINGVTLPDISNSIVLPFSNVLYPKFKTREDRMWEAAYKLRDSGWTPPKREYPKWITKPRRLLYIVK